MKLIDLQDEEMQKRSFPEDEKYDNGSYYRKCMFCGGMFIGYKRRVCCKLCEELKEKEMKERNAVTNKNKPIEESYLTLVERLRSRAHIRRNIKDRKSVQEGKPDRIAALLIEAADEIELLEMRIENLYEDLAGEDL